MRILKKAKAVPLLSSSSQPRPLRRCKLHCTGCVKREKNCGFPKETAVSVVNIL